MTKTAKIGTKPRRDLQIHLQIIQQTTECAKPGRINDTAEPCRDLFI